MLNVYFVILCKRYAYRTIVMCHVCVVLLPSGIGTTIIIISMCVSSRRYE